MGHWHDKKNWAVELEFMQGIAWQEKAACNDCQLDGPGALALLGPQPQLLGMKTKQTGFTGRERTYTTTVLDASTNTPKLLSHGLVAEMGLFGLTFVFVNPCPKTKQQNKPDARPPLWF